MNYYIQGDAANADKIRAAFEKLGIDVLDFGFADKTVVYCSIGGACVQSLPYGINLMHILHSHPDYQELELPVEPKFKVGDWIVIDNCHNSTYQIDSVRKRKYEYMLKHTHGGLMPFPFSGESRLSLWSIADTKDGDVLVCYSEVKGNPIEQAGIFKQYVGRYGGCSNTFLAHTGIDWDGNIIINGYMGGTNILPATKEQRDLLFAKMREAGYEWDSEKKELRKIKPHYDISNFHVGMPVLVRDNNGEEWRHTAFSHMTSRFCENKFAAGCTYWCQCIPFNDDTKHLLGTTDMCPEEYINW